MLERRKKRVQSLQFWGGVCSKVFNANLLNFPFFFFKECNWSETIPWWWKCSGSEVCSNTCHVYISGGICCGWIWLCRNKVKRWCVCPCLHPCWQSRARKICVRGNCTWRGLFQQSITPGWGIYISDQLLVQLFII